MDPNSKSNSKLDRKMSVGDDKIMSNAGRNQKMIR